MIKGKARTAAPRNSGGDYSEPLKDRDGDGSPECQEAKLKNGRRLRAPVKKVFKKKEVLGRYLASSRALGRGEWYHGVLCS